MKGAARSAFLWNSLREMLSVAGHRDPAVHRLLPNRNMGRLEAGIGDGPDRNADQPRLPAQLDVDRGAAFRAKERLDDIAIRARSLEAPGFTGYDEVGSLIIGQNAEWR